MKTRVIIADDHQLFTEGLQNLLSQESHLEFLPPATDGKDLLAKLENDQVDLILLDVSMPEMDGIEAAKHVIKKYPQTHILMVTMNDQPDTLKALIQIGIHGIILKYTSKTELLLAISEIMVGNTYFSQKIMRQLASDYRPTDENDWQLTKREKEVLQLIYEGMTTYEIAKRLSISNYTVETHRKNLYAKSGLKKSAHIIKRAKELGYVKG